MNCPLAAVRSTANWVVSHAKAVKINDSKLGELADELARDVAKGDAVQKWAEYGAHLHPNQAQSPEHLAEYVLALDAINFCFWPSPDGLEYDDVASALKRAYLRDQAALSPDRLRQMDGETLTQWFGGRAVPQLEERVRLLREVGETFSSSGLEPTGFAGLIRRADKSASRFVSLVTAALPGFRDHAVYRGRQTFLYKRVQILAADLWGAFDGTGLGEFTDVAALTTFPDYRVPQLLRALEVMEYSPELAAKVDAKEEIPAGSEQEIEIRAATVVAVERLRDALAKRGQTITAVEVDWILWGRGEAQRDSIKPHHRTLTIFY
eukprot:TRINITY_DN55419_c0_g1_i1.p1 TRINITY_DN55419_c0_g1~~TRINITY_DN55419_c0_g1_i1.p1  ORF type:complete len:330 (-),score=57.11 TRINITY_DN55419_c0_g1_i1:86-1051(-)